MIAAGADLIHFDVMDNHYVPNLTIGPMVCSAIKPHVGTTPIDVHLMVKAGRCHHPGIRQGRRQHHQLHPEASEHIDRTIALIRDCGCRPGPCISIRQRQFPTLDYTLDKLDLVLLMSVNPASGGQKFIDGVLPRLPKCVGALMRPVNPSSH